MRKQLYQNKRFAENMKAANFDGAGWSLVHPPELSIWFHLSLFFGGTRGTFGTAAIYADFLVPKTFFQGGTFGTTA